MNTPAHALVNLAVLSRGGDDGAGARVMGAEAAGRAGTWTAVAVLAGGIVPDLPMVLFYGWQKLAAGAPEAMIWDELYFRPGWQAFFDAFNSLPLLAVGLYVAWRLASLPATGLFLSMGLHVLADVPLHVADAHRPFFPLSDWRFRSPVSYWNPAHHGRLVGALELAVVVGCAVWAFRRFESTAVRAMAGLATGAYLAQWAWAFWMWG